MEPDEKMDVAPCCFNSDWMRYRAPANKDASKLWMGRNVFPNIMHSIQLQHSLDNIPDFSIQHFSGKGTFTLESTNRTKTDTDGLSGVPLCLFLKS